MEIGASSACFYPLETEKSLLHIAELGFRHCEIFINSPSELSRSFISEIKTIKDAYGMDIVSLHPYGSFAEGYNFFSGYYRRFQDGVEDYKRYFDAAHNLGARYIVMHGARKRIDISMQEYAERFGKLNSVAQSFGCNIAHENVVKFVSAYPEFMAYLKKHLGDDFKMVLDVKQARRAGVDVNDFIDTMGKSIAHVHLSDFSAERDCIPPSEQGLFDFEGLFRSLHKAGYDGRYIIELYSNGFLKRKEIKQSALYLEDILTKVRING